MLCPLGIWFGSMTDFDFREVQSPKHKRGHSFVITVSYTKSLKLWLHFDLFGNFPFHYDFLTTVFTLFLLCLWNIFKKVSYVYV